MTEPTILDTLVERLEEYRYRMEDNSALDYYGSQIADELNKILVEVDTMRLIEESRTRHEKHLADLATQNAPARSCSSGEGKDRTNNLQEEGTAMTSMTETLATTKDGTCPIWCEMHPPLEPEVHAGTVFATRFTIGLVQRPGEEVTIYPGETSAEGLTLDDAQWLVRGVQMAIDAARSSEEGK